MLICLALVSAVTQRFWHLFGLDQTAPFGPRVAWYSCRLLGGDENSLRRAIVLRRVELASSLCDAHPSDRTSPLLRLGPTVITEFFNSFLAQLIWLYIYFGFGLAVFASNSILVKMKVEDVWPGLALESELAPQFRLSFGQIMPLILLLLPFLAAAEAYKGRPTKTSCSNQVII